MLIKCRLLKKSNAYHYKLPISIYLTDKAMGNSSLPSHQLFASYIKNPKASSDQHPFIVKQLLAQSPQQHQKLISKITRLKQTHSDLFLKIIDSHTIQTHHLCSVTSQIYILMEKPAYTLKSYWLRLASQGISLRNEEILAILSGFAKAVEHLAKQDEEYLFIDDTMIFVNEGGNNQISIKFMHPALADYDRDESPPATIEQQLALVLLTLKPQITQDLVDLIDLLRQGRIGMKDVASRLPDSQRKSKTGLKLFKNGNQPKPHRDSINSLASNGESLMINGGDVSELMFKDFYEHFDDISEIEMKSLAGYICSETLVYQQTSHQFPRKYVKSKAFKKTNKSESASEWWSEKASENHNITRDQSAKDNFRIESKTFLLGSAKLVESFVSELHH